MKRKWITYEVISVFAIIIAFLLSLCASFSVRDDVQGIKLETSQRALESNTVMCGKQVTQFFETRLEETQSLAAGISVMDLSDYSLVDQLLKSYTSAFQNVGMLDARGNDICGDTFSFSDLSKEEYYTSLVSGTSVIAPEICLDSSGNDVFYFFAPVVQAGKTRFIVAGSVTAASLSHDLDAADFVGSGCLCIMNADGDYLLGDSAFHEMLDGKESNHFTHVAGKEAEQLEKAFAKREKTAVTYSYASVGYRAYYIPLAVQNWYLAATVPQQQDTIQTDILSSRTWVLLWMSLLFDILAVLGFTVLVWELWKTKKANRRHVLLQQCDRAVSFELSFQPHVLKFYGDLRSMIGVDPGDLYGEAVYDVYEWIHEDDASLRGRLHQFFDSDEDMFSAEVRIRNAKGYYSWYRIIGVMQRDQWHKKKKNMCFVGRLTNVDEEVTEEKDLMRRAENDLLTGILNKTTTEKRVTLMLKKRKNCYVIFYMIDLDNFKNVNDTLGHIYGDQAIVETAQALNKVFSDQDCIGRLGGDEFAVCVTYQAFDEQNLLDFIEKKAEKICQVNRRTYTDGASKVAISSSVGVAYAPDMGESFEALYTKADRALYYSKENGKNCYHIYSGEDA